MALTGGVVGEELGAFEDDGAGDDVDGLGLGVVADAVDDGAEGDEVFALAGEVGRDGEVEVEDAFFVGLEGEGLGEAAFGLAGEVAALGVAVADDLEGAGGVVALAEGEGGGRVVADQDADGEGFAEDVAAGLDGDADGDGRETFRPLGRVCGEGEEGGEGEEEAGEEAHQASSFCGGEKWVRPRVSCLLGKMKEQIQETTTQATRPMPP